MTHFKNFKIIDYPFIKFIYLFTGGIYSAQLEHERTSVLVISEAQGDKFRFARKWGLPCVGPDWVFDSVKTEYALAPDAYVVEAQVRASTPTEKDSTGEFRMIL